MKADREYFIKKLNDKDIQAFEALFTNYHGRLVLFALKFTTDIQDARDIVQDAFMSLWENAGDIHSSPSAYLFQSVRNRSLNYIRQKNTIERVEDELTRKVMEIDRSLFLNHDNPLQSLLEKELEQRMEEIVEGLPEKCRIVFQMSRREQLQHKEIAEKMGVSVKAIERHITKALSILRDELKEFYTVIILLILEKFII